MLVVCDTTPLNYLVQIDLVDLIPRLFDRACIPEAVLNELLDPKAPRKVGEWIVSPPDWLSIRNVRSQNLLLSDLHSGEAEAIVLAMDMDADFFLSDDFQARTVAKQRGLAVLTTLLVLEAAAKRRWISLSDAVDKLLQTNFRIDKATIEKLLDQR